MKKVIMLAAVVAALVSCQSKGTKSDQTAADSLAMSTSTSMSNPTMEEVQVWEGVLPAADGPGIRYVLTLNTIANANDTTYILDMTYLDADGKGKDKTFTSKGKPEVVKRAIKDRANRTVTRKGLKLRPNDGSQPVYFVIANDTTLTLCNDSLQESQSDLNYDIYRVQ